MNKENFAKSIFDVIKNLPKFEKKPQVRIIKVISLEETINSLTEGVKNHLRMSFKEFSGMGKVEKVNVIVSFLAMLELVKQGIIEVSQENKFDDIKMESKHVGVPTY